MSADLQRVVSDTENRRVRNRVSAVSSVAEIWVADDNADVRLLLEKAFRREAIPVPVRFFGDGSMLLDYAEQERLLPKVLLLDLEMPRMDGLQTIDALRNEPQLKETCVIMFSSVDNPLIVTTARALGVAFYLKKPVGEEYRKLAVLCGLCAEHTHTFKPAVAAITVRTALECVTRGDSHSTGDQSIPSAAGF